MSSRSPLSELRNQRQPRRQVSQTYGKKRPAIKAVHQDIFGHDGEIELREQLVDLNPRSPSHLGRRKENRSPIRAKNKEQTNSTACPPKVARNRPVGYPGSLNATSRNRHEWMLTDEYSKSIDEDTEALAPLLKLASSAQIQPFSAFSTKVCKNCEVVKIGEGSFAEVFRLATKRSSQVDGGSDNDPSADPTSRLPSDYISVLKLIPLEHPSAGRVSRENSRLSSAASVAREVTLLDRLDKLHGFTRYRGLHLVRGSWPPGFLAAFKEYQGQYPKKAVNDDPSAEFSSSQIYAIVEMDDAGSEVSDIRRPSAFQVYDIFWMTTVLLANAEESVEFEHRDLHLSNICVRKASPATNDLNRIAPTLDIDRNALKSIADVGKEPVTRLGLADIKVTLIDYTISRARFSWTEHRRNRARSRERASPLASKCMSRPKQLERSSSGLWAPTHAIREDESEVSGEEEGEIIFDPVSTASIIDLSKCDDNEGRLQFETYLKCRRLALSNSHRGTSRNLNISNGSDRAAQLLSTLTLSDSQLELEGLLPATQLVKPEPAKDKWREHIPQTNVLWLSYLLTVLIGRARGRVRAETHAATAARKKTTTGGNDSGIGGATPSAGKLQILGTRKFTTQIQNEMWAALEAVQTAIDSGAYVTTSHPTPTATATTTANIDPAAAAADEERGEDEREELEIKAAHTFADTCADKRVPGSAVALLNRAVDEGWLSMEEVVRFKTQLEEEDSGSAVNE